MDIHCNAGVTSTNLIGDYPGYGTVWYHPKGIANILSLSRVKNNGFRVTYDSVDGNEFVVSKQGTKRIVTECSRGLYYTEAAKTSKNVALFTTVADNKSKFSVRDYSRAVVARKI
jgi:hypothetical protein